VDPQHEPGQPVPRRAEDAVAERLLPRPEGGADLAVVRGPFDRDLPFARGRRGGFADQVCSAGEEEDGEQDQYHWVTP